MTKKLTTAGKKHLRGLAHSLRPLVQIGKTGLTEKVVAHIDRNLQDHELIKVRFNDFKEEKKDLAALIAVRTQSELVGLIGNVATFYREHPEEEKRIPLPKRNSGSTPSTPSAAANDRPRGRHPSPQ